MADKFNTTWSKTELSTGMEKYTRGTHIVWSRLFDSQHVFTVLPKGTVPGPNDGGYASIDAALRVKGML